MTNKNSKSRILGTKIIAFFVCLSFVMMPLNALAATASQLQAQKDYYTAQAEAARKQAAQKAQQAQEVKQQISSISSQINQNMASLDLTQSQINDTNGKINEISANIKTEEDNLVVEKDKMNNILASWYMEGEGGLLETMIGANNLSEIVTKQQYYDSIKQQIRSNMDKINQMKADLQTEKGKQEAQMSVLNGLKDNQTQQQKMLESNKVMKNRLLNDTTAAVSDLNAQAQQAEAKAQEIRKILASIYSSSKGTPMGSELVSSIDSGWYYNQTDYPDTYMSPSRLTIKDAGCLITLIAMIATKYGNSITPPGVVAASNFSYDGSFYGFKRSVGVSVGSTIPVNWDTINSEIAQGHPVIVSVKVAGPVYNFDGSNHFIVIKGFSDGKYLIHDPYWRNSSYNKDNVISMKIING
ncbi:MAG: C39 family peptidase [Patescibacteria group bacterium]|nr:C39 family peptidase [Patescibacteria group bacterium]